MSQTKVRKRAYVEVTVDLKWFKIKVGGEWEKTEVKPNKPKQKPAK